MNTDHPNEFNKEEWLKSLKENPQVQEFFTQHRKSSVEDFCEGYVWFKEQSLRLGDRFREKLDEEESAAIDMAMGHLKAIQQKKLFDAQCLWRAGQLEIPEIFNSVQFKAWEYRVMDCPFIAPLTEVDIEWYTEFLTQQTEVPALDFYVSWQDYEDFKKNYRDDEEGTELPEWYDFHNMKTGNGVYLTYPDTRGETERYYLDIKYAQDAEDDPQPPEIADEESGKPWLSRWDNKVFLQVAEMIEEKKTLRRMAAYHLGTEVFNTYEHERAEEDFRYLSTIRGKFIPIEANRDFREALHLAVEKHRLNKVIEYLPSAFEKFRLMRENGLSPFLKSGLDMYDTFQKMALDFDEAIRQGKRLSEE